jgi:hypothetical protein
MCDPLFYTSEAGVANCCIIVVLYGTTAMD